MDIKNMFSLEGKVALVTGAAYGIGFAMAEAFAAAGAKICFNCRSQHHLDQALADYAAKGIEAHGYICDVTDEEQVKAMVAQIEEEVGVIDILVNNAGIIKRIPMLEMSTEEFRQVIDIRNSGKDVVQDRTIYEDAMIFAPNLYSMGLMESRDFENYKSLFELMTKFLQPPDLLIYLRASVPTLIRQIAKRNRDYEQSIRLDYLSNLNDRYEEWISGYKDGKLLIIDMDNLDVEKPEDLSVIIEKIEASLNGLF